MTPASRSRRRSSRWLPAIAVAAAAAAALAACGSAKTTSSPAASTASTASKSTSTTAPAGVTIGSADVAGVGTVLVNGQGRTLYLLTSERGGKLTCTDDNGCTKVWPDTELPAGVTAATAGTGVDASKLGTVKGSGGGRYVTYAGWPLYTFSHDQGPGTANGEGIMSFGGTWETLTPAGAPVTPTGPRATTTTVAATSTTAKPYGY